MRITIEQTQKHALTQRQMQSLHILEMSVGDLDVFLSEHALENPFVLYERPHAAPAYPADAFTDVDAYLNRQHTRTRVPTLRAHLLEQAADAGIPDRIRSCVRFLIENVDQSGYLDLTASQTAALCGVSQQDADSALFCLQAFDPPGVGARDLRECLLIQERRAAEPDALVLSIIDKHLDVLAKRQYSSLCKWYNADEAAIQKAIARIRQLNPKPGNGFSPMEDTPYAPPDLLVEPDDAGVPTVRLNPAIRFTFRIDTAYAAAMRRQCADDPDGRAYLNERLQTARMIDRGLLQRENTLLLCGKEIVARQRAFFTNRSAPLAPHRMREVASALSLHASTVTRALKNKTLYCPRGTFPLSAFFCPPVSTNGSRTAADIKNAVRQLVGQEPKAAPYSDQQLTKLLAGMDIHVSRRAVANYREAAGIPSSFYRRSRR